ncbi:MAG: SAM-dependent methyltransferase [Microgenomates group bacterium]
MPKQSESGSFRDPSGHVYYQDGQIFRQINHSYQDNYQLLMSSGLYDDLVKSQQLISHTEITSPRGIYKIIQPTPIPFISYPYEWCFSQLQQAALLTLNIQKKCLHYGLSLKDASAFNIQFIGKKPIFIDTLSFEKYVPDSPWVAYRQFCQHFLAPLALMSYTDIKLHKLSQLYLDGIPLDLASHLLPASARLNFGIFGHLILNATSQQIMAAEQEDKQKYHLSLTALENLVESLINTVSNLTPKIRKSTWGQYYSHTNYDQLAFKKKADLVSRFLRKTSTKTVLDLGANNGLFSQIAAKTEAYVISADYDEKSVEDNFTHSGSSTILPLVIDFMNPSPNSGWANTERKSFWDRLNVDVIMMLATIHHLAIANNLPFSHIASLISHHCRYLIIEFVDKQDSQVQILLSHRQDIFTNYDQATFETEFGKYFKIISREPILHSHRCLYLMKKK